MIIRPEKIEEIRNPDFADYDIDPGVSTKPTKPWDKPYHYWLYVLALENNKYYIGTTRSWDPYDRIMQHVESSDEGAAWTRKNKPIKVLEIRDLGIMNKTRAEAMEQNLAWGYVEKYGMNSVRGGNMNDPSRMLRIGEYYWLNYQYRDVVISSLLLLAIGYILLRHQFNWW